MTYSKEQENQLYTVMLTVKAIDENAALYIIKSCEKKLCNMSSKHSLDDKLRNVESAIINYLDKHYLGKVSSPRVAIAFWELAHYYFLLGDEHESNRYYEYVYTYLKKKSNRQNEL